MIGRQDDRPAVGRDLDRSPRHAVGQGLAAELGRERTALETHADAIRGRGDAPRPVGEGIRAVVRAWQHAKGDRPVVASGAVWVHRWPHQLGLGWPATVGGVRLRDLVARPDGPAVEPAEPAGQAGRPGAEHDRDVDATGDGQVATGSATRPPASAGSLEGDLIAGRDPVAASHAETPPTDDAPAEVGPGQPDQAAGSGAQPRPDQRHLESRLALVVARQETGHGAAPGIGGSRHGHPEVGPAWPAGVLDGRQQAAIEDVEDHRAGTKRTAAPGLSSAGSVRAGSKRTVSVRPIRFQPPGIAWGYTADCSPAIATLPAGTRSRGLARRGVERATGRPPR